MKTNLSILLLLCLNIWFLSYVDNDIRSIVRAGNIQILSTINANSCFHLMIPDDDSIKSNPEKFKKPKKKIYEAKQVKENIKTNAKRNKSNNKKAGAVHKK